MIDAPTHTPEADSPLAALDDRLSPFLRCPCGSISGCI